MSDEDLDRCKAAYINLLQIPLTSPERLRAGAALAILRDLIAEGLGRSSEEVQNAYELAVSQDFMRQAFP